MRGVWSHHDLLSRHSRLLRLERFARVQDVRLRDEQIRMLERHIETRHTGDLVVVDTFFVEVVKGVAGRVYL